MAYIKNDGDVILDAVLTTHGRSIMAMGQQPPIVQWGAADTEIDYSLFNTNNSSGSAFYDVDLFNTPIFEPSTYSQTAFGSGLFTLADNTLQYLPVLKLNQSTKVSNDLTTIDAVTNAINLLTTDSIISLVTSNTVQTDTSFIDARQNILVGASPTTANVRAALTSRFIRVDQGFDSQTVTIPLIDTTTGIGMQETQYSIYVNRLFLKVLNSQYQTQVSPIVVANPFLKSQSTDIYEVNTDTPGFFAPVEIKPPVNNSPQLATSLATNMPDQVGIQLQFSLQISDYLASNLSYYFSTYGISYPGATLGGVSTSGQGVYQISTTVRVVGNKYGFALDIPVKLFYKA